MSTLAYVQQYIGTSQARERRVDIVSIARIIDGNKRGRSVIVVWISCAVIVYLVAVYSLFGLSVTLAGNVKRIKTLTESNTIMELDLRQKQTEFARNNEDIFQSMEKIVEIRYVGQTEIAVSRAD